MTVTNSKAMILDVLIVLSPLSCEKMAYGKWHAELFCAGVRQIGCYHLLSGTQDKQVKTLDRFGGI
jgi:hypothetical protein